MYSVRPVTPGSRRLDLLSVLAAAILWSSGGVFIKILFVRHDMTAPALTCWRSLFAAAALCWALPRLKNAPRLPILAASACYGLVLLLFVAAMSRTSSANAIYLQYVYPLFVGAAAWALLGERLDPRRGLGLALGAIGVGVIVVGPRQSGELPAIFMALASGILLAAFTLICRFIRGQHAVGLTAFGNLFVAAALAPMAWGPAPPSPQALLLLAGLGAFQIALPYVLFIRALGRLPATTVSLLTLLEPVLNPLWTWMGLGEIPATPTFIGGAMLLAALIIEFTRPAPPKASGRTSFQSPSTHGRGS